MLFIPTPMFIGPSDFIDLFGISLCFRLGKCIFLPRIIIKGHLIIHADFLYRVPHAGL